jgi:hypothetical protein
MLMRTPGSAAQTNKTAYGQTSDFGLVSQALKNSARVLHLDENRQKANWVERTSN